MKERWFNYRPIFLVFCFLLLGSVFAFYVLDHIIVTILTASIIFGALFTISIWKKKVKYFLLPFIAFLMGCLSFYLVIYSFKRTDIKQMPATVQVRIYNVSNESNGLIVVEADRCVVDGKKINDNITLFINDSTGLFTDIKVGNIIEFKPYSFYQTDLLKYNIPNTKFYSNNLKYTASTYVQNVKLLKTDKTLAEIFKENVKENLQLGLTNENAEIAYSALFGDKDMLSNKQYATYRLAGVAHFLAVSGLHVGIIVVALNFILNLCKANKWLKFSILALFLLFYAYLCGFATSIIRASIMALILLFSKNVGRQYDPLNSIGVAGIVIFLINPLCVFDVSFLLSFSCVLGITLFSTSFKAVLVKAKLNEKLSDALAISAATTLTIIIIMAYYFKTLNIISLLANVILIPLFTIGFTVVFIISLISLIIPPISYLMYPVNYIFDFINITANILGNLPISNFETIDVAYIAIFIYFILLLFMSRFCTAKKLHKLIAIVPIFIALALCLIL